MARYLQTVLIEASDAGPDTRLLVLQDPDGWDLPPFRPGAHLLLHLKNGMTRAYSLCGDPAVRDRYLVAVKRETAGRGGSAFVHDDLKPGDRVDLSPPRSHFPLVERADRHVFLAGGIGVTPFLSMIPALQRRGEYFILHVLSRGAPPLPDQIALLEQEGNAIVHDTRTGRPDLAGLIGTQETGTHLYACGPGPMLEAITALTEGWPAGHVHVEHFTPPAIPADPLARDYTLILARSGAEGSVSAGDSMLQAARALGADIDYSCEGGICGACRARWLDGEPLHKDRVLSSEEREHDVILCVAGCAGPKLVLDL